MLLVVVVVVVGKIPSHKQMSRVKIPPNCRFISNYVDGCHASPLWMSVVEQSHLSKWFPWTDVPVTAPSSAPITPPTQPTNLPFTSQATEGSTLCMDLFLYNHFLHPSITLDYITFQLAQHSSRRRGGGARIDPLPLSWAATLPPCPSIPRELSFPVQGMAFGDIFPGLEVGHFQCQNLGFVYRELTSLPLALAESLSLGAV